MGATDQRTFVTQLFMLIKTAQLHEPGNRAFQLPFEQFMKLLERVIIEEGAIALESIEVSLFFNEKKIRSDIATFGIFRFLDDLFQAKGLSGLRISKMPQTEEVVHMLKALLPSKGLGIDGCEAINLTFTEKGFDSIEFLPPTTKRTASQQDLRTSATSKRRALSNYSKAMDVFRNAAVAKPEAQALESKRAKRIVYDLVDICLEEGFSFIGLGSIKNYDEYTFNHSVNVCVISIGFGKNLGLTKRQMGELGIAGLYHDFGKTDIPLAILNKPGKFEPAEWEIMKLHPLKSIKRMLDTKGGFQPMDIKKMIAAFEHHRNYDCTGYPQTGVKKKLNFYSRVVAIADAYDAMTTNRVYQRGMLPTVALKILVDNAGTKFDPLLVKAFINTVGIYPVGSIVRLNSGALGIVTDVNKLPDKLARPRVKLVISEGGQKLENGESIDLAESASLLIETVVHPEDYNINVAQLLFGDAIAAKNKPAA